MNRNSEVTADEFIARIQQPDARLKGLQISGGVYASELTIMSGNWSGCRFLGGIVIQECLAKESLVFSDVTVDGVLSIAGLTFEDGGLEATSCRVLKDMRLSEVRNPRLIYKKPLRVEHGVTTDESFGGCGINLTSVSILGSLTISDGHLDGDSQNYGLERRHRYRRHPRVAAVQKRLLRYGHRTNHHRSRQKARRIH